jgi:hypothetical protein
MTAVCVAGEDKAVPVCRTAALRWPNTDSPTLDLTARPLPPSMPCRSPICPPPQPCRLCSHPHALSSLVVNNASEYPSIALRVPDTASLTAHTL